VRGTLSMPGTSGTLVGIECDISGTFLFGGIAAGRASTHKKSHHV